MTHRLVHGWRPSRPDTRDYLFAAVHVAPLPTLPPRVSLRPRMPPVFDQGSLGSCTANAAALALAFEHGGGPYSRLQIYYGERVLEGSVGTDSGAELRDAVKVLNKTGAAPEADWPYVVGKFRTRPPAKATRDAKGQRISVYSALKTRQDFRQCLAAGFPFIGGFTVYPGFESDQVAATGVVPMPARHETPIGGHAVCIIGYDTSIHGGDYYEVQNSWGEAWGDQGRFWMPAAYLEDPKLASDFWTVRK